MLIREEPAGAILLRAFGIAQSLHIARPHQVHVLDVPEDRDAGELHFEIRIDETGPWDRALNAGGIHPSERPPAPRFHRALGAQREDAALEDAPEFRLE